MNRSQVAVLLSAIAVIVLAAFVFTRPGDDLRITRGVTIDGIDVAGLTAEEARPLLVSREDSLVSRDVVVLIDGIERSTNPEQLGFVMDHDPVLTEAVAVGRDGTVLTQFARWFGSFFGGTELQTPSSLSPTAVETVLDEWDQIGAELSDIGGVELDGAELVARYGAATQVVIREGVAETLLEMVLDPERGVRTLETMQGQVGISNAEVDRAFAQAEQLLAGDITLTHADPPATLILTERQLAQAFVATSTADEIVVSLDQAILEPRFQELRDDFSTTFQNAELTIDDEDNVVITPGSPGLRVDSAQIVASILDSSTTATRSGVLPVSADADPDTTVADLEALDIVHMVSSFTTYHDCCQNRVVNIQLMADSVNGTLVLPGESFSINDSVGERTEEKGYLPAGTIVNGEIKDTIGGGVSQFATTLYNAIFWGGYTDVTHRPHSIYFSRYPEGIEATLDFPTIDLAFLNETESAVYIKTEYNDGSITVKLFGNNGGRVVAGEQRSGSTNINIIEEGNSAEAVAISGSVSDRYDFVPPDTIFEANPELEPGTTNTLQSGRDGWSVTITRTKTWSDGSTETETWVARYRSQPLMVEVHPCEVPQGEDGYTGEPCPTTTTSTTVDETSSTTSSTTTTTIGGG